MVIPFAVLNSLSANVRTPSTRRPGSCAVFHPTPSFRRFISIKLISGATGDEPGSSHKKRGYDDEEREPRGETGETNAVVFFFLSDRGSKGRNVYVKMDLRLSPSYAEKKRELEGQSNA